MKKLALALIILSSLSLSGCAAIVTAGYEVKNTLGQTANELFSLPPINNSAYLQGKADARYQQEVWERQRAYNAGYQAGGGLRGTSFRNNSWGFRTW